MNDWTFNDDALADDFDRYVRGQLPWYDLASNLLAHVGRHFIPEGGLVYDVGASTGNVGRVLAPTLEGRSARLIAVERSAEMARAYRAPGTLLQRDVRAVEFEPFDFGVSFLALMFLPPADRAEVLDRMKAACRPGGALFLLEKQTGPAGYAGTLMRRISLAAKVAQGESPESIIDKELSLVGVQRPFEWGEELGLELFRFGEFVGWLWQPNYAWEVAT